MNKSVMYNIWYGISLFLILYCSTGCETGNGKISRQMSIKRDQYIVQGAKLYTQHCQNCHQADGTGLGQLIPPINSEFITNNKSFVVCGIKYGMNGSIEVDGKTYEGNMPSNTQLTKLEIAEIVTYISSNWGQTPEITSIREIDSLLKKCHH